MNERDQVEDKIDVTQKIKAEVVKTPVVAKVAVTPKSVAVLYHRNCTDGWCSAYQLKKKFPDAVLVSVNYNEDVPELPQTDLLIIADFSYSKEILLDLKSKVKEIVVLDHHITAQEQLKDLDFCTFDLNESGASLVAAYLKKLDPTYKAPWFVDFVKDRDLWTWTLPESRSVSAFIRTFDMTMEDWDKLAVVDVGTASKSGQAILAAQDQAVNFVLKNARIVQYEGHQVAIVNSSVFQSEIGEAACKAGSVFAVVFHIRSDGKVSVSFRSQTYDVSKEASRYGGGGHKLASGCVFDRYQDFVREIIRE